MILSVLEEPVSLASATVGAVGATVSSEKVKAVVAETLPATSVCRTSTVLAPCASCAAVGAVVLQVEPPSIRVLDLGPGLDAGQRQGGIVGDLIAARGACVVGQRHAGCGRVGRVERQGLKEARGSALPAMSVCLTVDGVGQPLHQPGRGSGARGTRSCCRRRRALDRRPVLHPRIGPSGVRW